VNLELVIAVVYLACATLLFIIAFLIYQEDQRKRINRIAALMFGFAAFGPLFYGLGQLGGQTLASRSALYNSVYIWELFFPQLVFFALCFPTETRFYNRFPRLKYLIFIPHIFHLFLTTVFADPDRLARLIDPKEMGTLGKAIFEPLEQVATVVATVFSIMLDSHAKLFSVVNFVYVVVAAIILYQGTKRVVAVQLRKQVVVVIYGIISALAMYVAAFILPSLGIMTWSPGIATALTIMALVLGCGSIIWAIVRYRFMDVRLIVRQSLVYTVTSALVVGAYVLIIRQVEKIISTFFGVNVPGVDVVFIIIALILFQPVMSQMDELIRKLFIRDKSDFRNISQNFSRSIAAVFDLRDVFALAQVVLKDQLLIERSYIFMKQDSPSQICTVAAADSGSHGEMFDVEDELVKEVSASSGVINLDELIAKYPRSELVQHLARLKVRFLTPLVSGDEMLGCMAVSDKVSGYRLNYEDVTTILTVASQLAVAITRSRLYQESVEKQRLEEEMNIARSIQRELLPRDFPRGKDFEFSAYSEPSRQVGGDYFDFIMTPRKTYGLVVGDASGKGMPAALLISQIQAAIRSEVRHESHLGQVLCNVNDLIQQSSDSEKFATLFLAEFDPRTKILRYSNAGHNYPIVVSEQKSHQRLDRGGTVLGAFADVGYDQGEVQLRENDVLLFYTDGLNEATDDNDQQYGEERIMELITKHRDLTPREIERKIVDDVRSFAGSDNLQDDMTLVILKVS
jgi:serine phosphatase RsbU (regulator of sigma subunit)